MERIYFHACDTFVSSLFPYTALLPRKSVFNAHLSEYVANNLVGALASCTVMPKRKSAPSKEIQDVYSFLRKAPRADDEVSAPAAGVQA